MSDPPAPPTYLERHRPQIHYSPARQWVNDPNGLVFAGGLYHLFYQHNPHGNLPGHLSWGHATSPDLVHWSEHQVALPARGTHEIYSGSVVTDPQNTSGLGAEGVAPLVALYTGHTHDHPARRHLPQRHHQAQFLAYSQDAGASWRYGGEQAVLDLNRADFRDPKVFRDEARARWVMVLVHPVERQVGFYASADLHAWTPLSTFGPAGETAGIWEVPEFFPLRDLSGRERWVLKVDFNPGGSHGGSGGQYWVGDWDGEAFIPLSQARPLDHGKDFYAALSFSDLPGRRVWLAWMNNWQYAQLLPTSPWRGHFTVPRELSLGPEMELIQQPIAELETLRDKAVPVRWPEAGPPEPLALAADTAYELRLQVELVGENTLQLEFHSAKGVEVAISLNHTHLTLTRPSRVSEIDGFSGTHQAALPALDGPIDMHLLLDTSSLEVFAAGGRVVLSDLLFPASNIESLHLHCSGEGTSGDGRLYSLRSIWNRG